MDDFLRDIHVMVFKEWILMQKSQQYCIYIDENDEDIVDIETDDIMSQITFNEFDIIELSVKNKRSQEVEFYIHFQMKNLNHAIGLFNEMLGVIDDYTHQPQIKILLCCSGGLSTGFFAQKMNDAFQLLNLSMEVEATGYYKLYQIGNYYDVILLAPQVSYCLAEVKSVFKNRPVLVIPSSVFGKYDVSKMIELIQKSLQVENHNEKGIIPDLKTPLKHQQKILSLSIYRNMQKYSVSYHLYDENQKMILQHDIIKNNMSIHDIYSVLDTVFIQYPDVNVVCVSVSTVVSKGVLQETIIADLKDNDLYSALTNHYHKNFYISNDANNAAMGYYATHNNFSSLVFLFQPIEDVGGCGIIINGSLYQGRQNIAGEVKYLPLALSDDYVELTMTPFGTYELVSKILLSIMSVIDPQMIVIKSDLILNPEELRQEIGKYIPKEYIPPIDKVNDLKEYILLGNMVWCSQMIE